ncbi:unnamed protein product, partial [Symbiodinium sp. CCMP2592]
MANSTAWSQKGLETWFSSVCDDGQQAWQVVRDEGDAYIILEDEGWLQLDLKGQDLPAEWQERCPDDGQTHWLYYNRSPVRKAVQLETSGTCMDPNTEEIRSFRPGDMMVRAGENNLYSMTCAVFDERYGVIGDEEAYDKYIHELQEARKEAMKRYAAIVPKQKSKLARASAVQRDLELEDQEDTLVAVKKVLGERLVPAAAPRLLAAVAGLRLSIGVDATPSDMIAAVEAAVRESARAVPPKGTLAALPPLCARQVLTRISLLFAALVSHLVTNE